MSIDSLLKALPESPWLTILLVVIIIYLMAERIINFAIGFTDRRSDGQLLEQAEKATLILDKLPERHESRAHVLTYIANGPIAELSRRQSERLSRSKKAPERGKRTSNMVLAFLGASLFLVFMIEASAPTFFEVWADDRAPYAFRIWFMVFMLAVIAAVYLLIAMIVYGAVSLTDKIEAALGSAAKSFHSKWVRRRQSKKGRGGTYEI
jgi:hypothetical protein